MAERLEVNGISFEIVDVPHPAVPRRRSYVRPDVEDHDAIAEWQSKPIPTNSRVVAEYLALWFGNACALCNRPVDMELKHPHPGCANVDHIQPSSSGGLSVWGNVRLSHRSCNMQRGNLALPEPSAPTYWSLLIEATSKFNDFDGFKPSAIWVARDKAALLVASRAMMLKMVETDVENGIESGFTDRTRAEIRLADARVESALAVVSALQATRSN